MHTVTTLATTPQGLQNRILLLLVGVLFLLLSLFALLPFQTLFAQEIGADTNETQANTISWSPLGPEGGSVESVAFDPSNTDIVYAGTSSAGVFKSTDGGATWTVINNGITPSTVYDVAVHPTTTSTLYAGTNGGVYKSTDGGNSWLEANTGLPSNKQVNHIAIDPSAPDTLYIGLWFGGVYKTTDGGANWALAYSSTNQNWGIVINPNTPSTVYAAMWGNGVMKSTDSGATWMAMNTGLGDTSAKALVINPAQPDTLYVSINGAGMFKTTDGGANWVEINTGTTERYATAVAIDPQNPDTLYMGATSGLGVYKTTDGGANWSQFGTGLNPDTSTFYFDALAVDPTNSAVVFAGVFDGVFKSSDSGANWASANSGLTAVDIRDIEFDPAVMTTLYAGGNSLHKSVDGGATWSALTNGLTNPFIQAIAVDTITPATVYVATGGSGVFKSTDSGASWANSSNGLPFNPQTPDIAIDPVTPTTLYLASNSGVYKTTDGAANWTLSSSGLASGSVNALAIDPSAPMTVYAAVQSAGLYKSVDGGATWVQSDTNLFAKSGIYSFAVSPSDANTLYAGTYAGVFRSTDGGADWSYVNNGLNVSTYALVVDPVISTTVYAGTYGSGVFMSTDGGDSWEAVNDSLGSFFVDALAITPGVADRILAGTQGSLYQGDVVLAPNAAPVAEDDTAVVLINTTATIDVLANDTDPEDDPLSISTIGAAGNGTAVISGTQVAYTPDTDFLGTDTFTYTISDGDLTDSATVTVIVSEGVGSCDIQTSLIEQLVATSSVQHANPIYASMGQSFTVPTGVTTIEGLDVYLSFIAGNATITLNLYNGPATGDIGTPIATTSYTNESSDTIWAPDVEGLQTPFIFDLPVPVTPGNEYYFLMSPSYDPVSFGAAFADGNQYADGDALNGMSDGTLTYLLFQQDTNDLKFSIYLCDPAANTAPTAVDDTAVATENTAVNINVLANDTDPEDDPLSLTAVGSASNGATAINGTQVTYTPTTNFTGTDTFTYTISDGEFTDSATVTMTVVPQQNTGSLVYVSLGGVSIFDLDTGNNEGFLSATNALFMALTPDNAYLYVVENSADTVAVFETATNTRIATISVNVQPIDIAITPDGAFAYVSSRSTGNVDVIATATNTVAATVSVGSSAFGLDISPNGQYVYVTNEFDNEVSVIDTASNTVVDTITSPDFDSPTEIAFTPDGAFAYVTNFNTGVAVIQTSTNTVVDTITVGNSPFGVEVTPNGAFAYVSNYFSNDVSVIRTSDNTVVATVPTTSGGTWLRDVGITPDGQYVLVAVQTSGVTEVIATATNTVVNTLSGGGYGIAFGGTASGGNNPPVAVDDTAETNTNTPVNINVLDNDSDPDSDPLSISAVGSAGNGTAVISNTQVTYTPATDFTGTDTFTYTISDGDLTDSATVTVTVSEIPNRPPVAVNDTAATDTNTPVAISVLLNDVDLDNDLLTITAVGNPANGAASISGSQIIYTPTTDFNGNDSFSYTISDGELTDSATVTVVVGSVACQTSEFVDINAALTPVQFGSVDWGDYDGDGDLDVALTGANSTAVFRNDGGGTFTDINANMLALLWGSIGWGDYDNDNDLDLLVTGTTGAANGNTPGTTKLYRNDNGTFVDTNVALPGIWRGEAVWGDYDDDNDLDILIAGQGTNARVYRNDGGTFTDIGAGLPNFNYASTDWGDYDGDDDLDILLTGDSTNGRTSEIYRNDGGTFTAINAGLPGVRRGDADWGDYDGDGDLDIVLTGETQDFAVGQLARIYANDGGTFTDINAGLIGLLNSGVEWGDYDNDGDLDLVLSGASGVTTRWAGVYRNDGNVLINASAGLLFMNYAHVTWGDYDNDSDLDILMTGFNGGGQTKIYRYDGCTPPIAVDDTAETAANTPALIDVLANDSDPDGGVLAISAVGNPTNGTAVLSGSQIEYTPASDFVGTDTFTYTISNGILTDTATVTVTVNSIACETVEFVDINAALTPVGFGSVAWGDYDNDGDLDIALTGDNSTAVFRNDGGGTFTDINANMLALKWGSIGWGDYDNDNDLDLLVTGTTGAANGNTPGTTKLYRNDNGTFVDTNAALPGIWRGEAVWGDYDDDNDLDILLAGQGTTASVYRNDGGTFTDIGAGLPSFNYASTAWGDYDGDNDLDILLTGDSTNGRTSEIYRNDGGTFTAINAGLTGVLRGDADWGDYDDDGDLDLVLTGETQVFGVAQITQIYRNDGGTFTNINAPLIGVHNSGVEWGDYDNDGDLDLVLSGASGVTTRWAGVYRNDSGDTFANINAGLLAMNYAHVTWGDYDNDNDLDILMTGGPTQIYRNDCTPPATVEVTPGTPATLGLSFSNGRGIDVAIGAGSLPAGSPPTTLTLVPNDAPTAAPGNFMFGGISFSLDAFQNGEMQDGFTFNPNDPPQITLTYTDGDVAGLGENGLSLSYYNEDTGTWETDGITVVSRDPAANTVTFAITHLTDFAMFGQVEYQTYLPLISRP